MNLNERLERERAVSPVVGVALLIAMTVILAAVIGYVVLGMNATGAEAPQATFSFDHNESDNEIEITHEGGDALDDNEIQVYIDDEDGQALSDADTDPIDEGSEMTAGETVAFTGDESVTIVWEDPNGDQSNVIGEHEF